MGKKENLSIVRYYIHYWHVGERFPAHSWTLLVTFGNFLNQDEW